MHILNVLDSVQGDKTRAAQLLGVSRRTLERRVAEWDPLKGELVSRFRRVSRSGMSDHELAHAPLARGLGPQQAAGHGAAAAAGGASRCWCWRWRSGATSPTTGCSSPRCAATWRWRVAISSRCWPRWAGTQGVAASQAFVLLLRPAIRRRASCRRPDEQLALAPRTPGPGLPASGTTRKADRLAPRCAAGLSAVCHSNPLRADRRRWLVGQHARISAPASGGWNPTISRPWHRT